MTRKKKKEDPDLDFQDAEAFMEGTDECVQAWRNRHYDRDKTFELSKRFDKSYGTSRQGLQLRFRKKRVD